MTPDRTPRRFAAHAAVVGALTMTVACGPNGAQESDVAGEDLITVPLGGAPDELDGHPWPTRDDGSPLQATTLERAVTVRVSMDGEQVLLAPSQLTSVSERDGRIVAVSLTPLPELMGLQAAVDEVAELLEQHDLVTPELTDELAEIRQQPTTQPEWPSTGERHGVRTEPAEELSLRVEFRQRGTEGWFAGLSLRLPMADIVGDAWPDDAAGD
ncbi:MAG: hypothetical protein JJT89_14555 [Nitriliruptoraceae bacterium]|nr:hypothetical protein [Nitriliruptoraceae bacterium]